MRNATAGFEKFSIHLFMVFVQSRALGCASTAFISTLGQSGFELPSGRSRFQAHLLASSGSNEPSSICKIYFPRTGKNFQPWKLPQVAMYNPLLAAWGEMIKSALVVKASLWNCQHLACGVEHQGQTHQQMRYFSIFQSLPFLP